MGVVGCSDDTDGGWRSRIDAIRLACVLPSNAFSPGEHLVQHRAEREDVGARVRLAALELLGRHVLERAEDRAMTGQFGGCRGERREAGCLRGGRADLRQPEIEELGLREPVVPAPDLVSMMLAGFRSRWTTPAACARSSASAICMATRTACSTGSGPFAIRAARVSPSRYSRTR